jgi:hypothetical protein
MTTTAEHAQQIVTLAGQADALIAQLKPILDSITAEENALFRDARKAGKPVVDAIAGRRRLAQYAQGRCLNPQHSRTVEQLATAAWSAYL